MFVILLVHKQNMYQLHVVCETIIHIVILTVSYIYLYAAKILSYFFYYKETSLSMKEQV